MHILTAKRNGGRDVAGGVVISLATSFRPLFSRFDADIHRYLRQRSDCICCCVVQLLVSLMTLSSCEPLIGCLLVSLMTDGWSYATAEPSQRNKQPLLGGK